MLGQIDTKKNQILALRRSNGNGDDLPAHDKLSLQIAKHESEGSQQTTKKQSNQKKSPARKTGRSQPQKPSLQQKQAAASSTPDTSMLNQYVAEVRHSSVSTQRMNDGIVVKHRNTGNQQQASAASSAQGSRVSRSSHTKRANNNYNKQYTASNSVFGQAAPTSHPERTPATKHSGKDKWKDLGEQHIVRAASVYSNIPMTDKKKLGVVIKKARERSDGVNPVASSGGRTSQNNYQNIQRNSGAISTTTSKPLTPIFKAQNSNLASGKGGHSGLFVKNRSSTIMEEAENYEQKCSRGNSVSSSCKGRGFDGIMPVLNSKQSNQSGSQGHTSTQIAQSVSKLMSINNNNFQSLRSSFHKAQDFESNMYYPTGIELPLKKANTHSGKYPSSSHHKSNGSSSRHNTTAKNSKKAVPGASSPTETNGGRHFLKSSDPGDKNEQQRLCTEEGRLAEDGKPDLMLHHQFMATEGSAASSAKKNPRYDQVRSTYSVEPKELQLNNQDDQPLTRQEQQSQEDVQIVQARNDQFQKIGSQTEEVAYQNCLDLAYNPEGKQQSQEFNMGGQDSRAAYFGGNQNHTGGLQHPASSFQGQVRDSGSNDLASLITKDDKVQRRGHTGSMTLAHTSGKETTTAASNFQNLNSPAQQNVNNMVAAQSEKMSTNKTNRKKEISKSSRLSGLQSTNKATKKKLNEMNSVYESKVMGVPGVNGAIVKTSTQELRAMNGYTVPSSTLPKPAKTTTRARKASDMQKKRLSTQSPSMLIQQSATSYQDANTSTNRAKNTPNAASVYAQSAAQKNSAATTAIKRNSSYQKSNHAHSVINRDPYERRSPLHRSEKVGESSGATDEYRCAAVVKGSHQPPHARVSNNRNGSQNSERNSLPEIGNRSLNDSIIEVGKGDETAGQQRGFYPSPNHQPINVRDMRSHSRERPPSEITISEDNRALVSLNQSSVLDHTGFTDNDITLQDIKVLSAVSKVPNLPNIAKQTVGKAAKSVGLKEQGEAKTQNNAHTVANNCHLKQNSKIGAGVTRQSKVTGSINNSNNYGQTGSLSHGNSASSANRTQRVTNKGKPRLEVRSPMGGQSTVNLKRETTYGKLLEPLKITEEVLNEKSRTLESGQEFVSAERELLIVSSQSDTKRLFMSSNKRNSGPSTATLKPLTHTPVVKKNQKSLISASKAPFQDAPNNNILVGGSAKTNLDGRKTTGVFNQKKTSIAVSNSMEKLIVPDEMIPEASELAQENTQAVTSPQKLFDVTGKSQVTTQANTKLRDKSPMRVTSLDRLAGQTSTVQRPWLTKDNTYSTILAQANTAEPYYRRAMKRLGWSQIPQTDQIKNFHIRFNIGDLEGASKDLQSRHFYNHFPLNRELVTKMGLCKNLWFNTFMEHEMSLSHIFPRCYDLSVPQQVETFVNDFNQTAILSIIKIMAQHFIKRNKDMQGLLVEYERIHDFTEPEILFKQAFRKKCQKVDMRSSGVGNLLGISEVRDAYSYAKDFCNSIQFKLPKKLRRHKFSRSSSVRFNESQVQSMVKFQSNLVDKGIPGVGFATYEQFKIVRLHHTLERLLPQYRQIDGTHNIWIVKPSYNARGHGIYCTRNMRDVLKDTDKTQQKVVQKYIERPFCIKGQKKFDFRQWVLVNSWEPLDVSVFSAAYLKLCGNEFDLKQIGDVYRHLSNYTIQKDNGDKIELVMSSEQFQDFMRESQPGQENFSWATDMLPKINDLVWRTLKSVQENIEQKANCFEVYGFDIVLDAELNPWVIEVNLSPACSERADWLTKMLNDSCLDLLKHIQSRILAVNPAEQWSAEMLALREQATSAPHKTTKSLNPKKFYEENAIKDRWVRLPESIQEIKEFIKVAYLDTVPQKGLQFELVGEKADLRYERKLDKGHQKETSSIEIQRVYRGYLGRKIYIRALRKKCAIIIQKNTRSLLAKCELIRLRQKRAATIVQKQLRRILAQRLAHKMDQERIHALKTAIVTKMQTRYRMWKASIFVHSVRQDQASRRCQRYLRGFLLRKQTLKERTKRCLIVRLQRFYKRRFQEKQMSAVVLQRIMKGRLQQRNTQKLKKVSRGGQRLEKTIQRRWQKNAVRHIVRHSRAVTIQSWLKMKLKRNEYLQKLQAQAQAGLRKLLRLYWFQELKNTAQTLKAERDTHATVIQKQLKRRQALKLLAKMRRAAFLAAKATLVKQFMRSYLARKEAKRQRIKIGAAIMIQALYRGFCVRRQLEIKRLWDTEQLAQIKQNKRTRRSDAKRGSQIGSYNTKSGRQSQLSNTAASVGPPGQRRLGEERSTRYQSNPAKFVKQGGNKAQNAARGMATNGSQGSLAPSQSHTSLRRGVNEDPLHPNKFSSQQSGNKKRKMVKKGSNGTKVIKDQHYEIGLRHLQNAHGATSSTYQEKFSQLRAGAQNVSMNRSQDKKYALQRVGKPQMESQQMAVQQRLGTKIASNLQKQPVKNLISSNHLDAPQLKSFVGAMKASHIQAPHMQQQLPMQGHHQSNKLSQGGYTAEFAARDSFDDRLDNMLQTTLQEQQMQEMAIVQNHNAFYEKEASRTFNKQQGVDSNLAQVMIARKSQHHITIDTSKSRGVGVTIPTTSVRTPVVNSSQTKQSKQMNQESQSQSKMKGQRSNQSLVKPLPNIKQTTTIRQSFELSSQLEVAQADPKVVARGLGKDENVTLVHKTQEKLKSGKGVATTVVMRKDPSVASLNSAREINSIAGSHKQTAQGGASKYRQHLVLSQQIDSKGLSTNLIKKTKEKSKQIRNLEKIVAHGAPYMHPMTKPSLYQRNTTNSVLRDKISEQQKQLAMANQIQNQKAGKTDRVVPVQPAGQGKSFAKYLNDMLESQGRLTGNSEAFVIATSVDDNNQHSSTQSKKQIDPAGIFSSGGKGSISGIKFRQQQEFKPVLASNSQLLSSETSSQHYKLPQVSGAQEQSQNLESRNERFFQDDHQEPSRTAQTSFVSRVGGQGHAVSGKTPKSHRGNKLMDNTVISECSSMLAQSRDNPPELEKSDFLRELDQQKRFVNDQKKQQTYSQAQAVFNKTKDSFLNQIKKNQDKKVEQVNAAHKKSQNMLANVNANGGIKAKRPSSKGSYPTSQANIETGSQIVSESGLNNGADEPLRGDRRARDGHNNLINESMMQSQHSHNFNSKKSTASSGRQTNNMVVI